MIIRPATRAKVKVVVPFGVLKAGFLSGCPVELGVVAASKKGTEDAEFHRHRNRRCVQYSLIGSITAP